MKKTSTDDPLVSIIILTYQNGLRHVKRCFASLEKITYKNYEIILVDNNSLDNTITFVKKRFPKVTIIANKSNLGFCRGNNQAVKFTRGKYILFLNNDTVVTPSFLNILVEILEEDKTIGVVQPKIRQLIKKNKLDACCSFITWTGFLYHYGYSQNQNNKKYNKRISMYSAKGACFLTRKDLIDRIGLFDEDYFAYFEETDFCHRVWLSGHKVEYIPESEIFHLGGANKKEDHPVSLQYISYRNRLVTYIKNVGTKYLIIILPLHLALILGVVIMFAITGRVRHSLSIFKAILWNAFHLNETLIKRKRIQGKLRKIREDQYINEIMVNPNLSYYFHFFIDPRKKYWEVDLQP